MNEPVRMRPLVGVTTYLERAVSGEQDVEAVFLPAVYLHAITAAGGTVVALPPQPVDDAIAEQVMAGLDGLVLTGGHDVDARRYGQEPDANADAPREARDEWESQLLRTAVSREVPFLAICRGLQLMNVELGGTLHQHLPEVLGSSRYSGSDGVFAENDVFVEPGSRLSRVLHGSTALHVRSYHHQAIDEVAPGLVVGARGDDGVIQAVELPSVPFGFAVQWHPEQDATSDARLFAALVDAAATRRARRSRG